MKIKLFAKKLMRPLYRRINSKYDLEWKRVEREIERLRPDPDKVINILPLDVAYDLDYFDADQFTLEEEWAGKISSILYNLFKPKSIVDVGCGRGLFLNFFQKKRVKILGLEGAPDALERLVVERKKVRLVDLRRILPKRKERYDLAMSFEVAEHIEREFAGIYINNIVQLSDVVVFTAFPPGKIETHPHHPNEQKMKYWEELFLFFGFELWFNKTRMLQRKLKALHLPRGLRQYEDMYVFVKKK